LYFFYLIGDQSVHKPPPSPYKVELSLYSEAFRIDWERAQPKAAKYSLYATIACFTQIMCLFVQLHYTELPAAAAQVHLSSSNILTPPFIYEELLIIPIGTYISIDARFTYNFLFSPFSPFFSLF
jgi:hypothetical protein